MPSDRPLTTLACRLAAIRIDLRAMQRMQGMQQAEEARNYEYWVQTANGGEVEHEVTTGTGGKWVANEVIATIPGVGKGAWEGVTHFSAKGSGKAGGLKESDPFARQHAAIAEHREAIKAAKGIGASEIKKSHLQQIADIEGEIKRIQQQQGTYAPQYKTPLTDEEFHAAVRDAIRRHENVAGFASIKAVQRDLATQTGMKSEEFHHRLTDLHDQLGEGRLMITPGPDDVGRPEDAHYTPGWNSIGRWLTYIDKGNQQPQPSAPKAPSKTTGTKKSASPNGRKAPLSSDIGWSDKQDVFAHAQQWAARLGVKPSSITIGPLPKKWGELQSPSNKLTINEDVLKLPKELGEYVILHEMTHMLAANHGTLFQSYLHAYMPDWQQREQRLREVEKGILQAKNATTGKRTSSGTKATGGGKKVGTGKAKAEKVPPLDRIAASMERLPDLNPGGASHEFYQSTVDGKTYFLKPSNPVGAQSAEMAYRVAQQLGLGEFVSPSWTVEHDGRTYQVMPMIPGTQMAHAEPAAWKAALAKIDPVTQAKLGLYSVMMGMNDVAGNNVMLTPEGQLVMIDTADILRGVGTTPVMLNAYFGNSLGLLKGESGGEKGRAARENSIRRMEIPPEAITWLKHDVLAHQSALLDQIDHIAQLHHSEYHEQEKWSGYTDMMTSAMVRFAALRQIANMDHPTWGKLESIVWWKNGKYTENALFQMVSYIAERYSWDHPAHNQTEVADRLKQFGIILTDKGITYKPKYPEGDDK